ncbi:MAG: hypothetical protein M1391_01840, partial [Bacteroidetes bacterium]|nr:hypothetical protein [Bacteroidota bacterium]
FLENKESKEIYLSPKCPFPADLVRLTQKQWMRFGEDSYSVSGVSLGEVYDMFFARVNEKRNLTENLLRVTLQRTEDLLIGIGQADHRNKMSKFNSEKRFIALMAISAFAIFLHKLGIKKEDYMRSSFFNIGRFLSLVDTLHFEWCRHVRGGYPEEHDEKKWREAIPPQLLGNSHLRIALENPATAFARLSERLNIYKAWVQKQQPSDGNWAHWAIAAIGKISSEIQDAIDEGKFPQSMTDIDKTQVLLGYLSWSGKKVEAEENLKINNSETIISQI